MKKRFLAKKFLTFFLMFAMIFSSMPLSAFADETGGSDVKTAETVVSYEAEDFETAEGTVDVDFKGLHDAQVNALKVYTYTDDTKGDTDLLEGKQLVADGYQKKYETVKLAAGDYLVEGYDSKGDCRGTIVVTVDGSKENNAFTIRSAYEIYATNSGWKLGQDYAVSVKVTGTDGTERKVTVGKSGEKGGCLFLDGDTVTATLTPIGDKADTFLPLNVTKRGNQTTSNISLSGKVSAAYTLTVNAPAGSVISAGNFKNYYIYDFIDGNVTKDDETGVTAVFRIPEVASDSYMNYNHHFIRVQNPNGVTYWDFGKWNENKEITVSSDDLHIGDASFTKNTAYTNYEKNVFDLGNVYLNINNQGYINLNQGESKTLEVFRDWQAIEAYINTEIALPDVHYQVIDVYGDRTNVVEIVPDENNSSVAKMTAKNNGTAIVLVTYDAMTHAKGQSGSDSKEFSAIWPEFTGVFVVTVGKDGTGIATNMTMDRKVADATPLDAEHDVLFYTGDTGASYSFTPEAGCAVTVARCEVNNGSLNYNGFNADGVTVNSETGEVTVSGLKAGRHIIKVEKGGVANYQVVTARQASYKFLDADGKELADGAEIKAGDKVTIQFTGLINSKEKLSGIYNSTPAILLVGEEGTKFKGAGAGGFGGLYDFSGNPERQQVTVTVPKYWAEDTYTLDGILSIPQQFGSPTGAHRGCSYGVGKGTYNGAKIGDNLCSLPQVVIPLAETDFITGTMTFKDSNGKTIDRKDLEITMQDKDGNGIVVKEDGTFKAVAEEYSYVITGQGVEYTKGNLTVTADGDNKFEIVLPATDETAWDGTTVTEPAKDENGVYLIGTGAELAWFSAENAANKNNISGKLTADINLGGYPWNNKINSAAKTTVLDGDGHTITNLNAERGLFGALGTDSKVSNLTIKGKSTGGGAVTGYANGSNVVIENCVSYVEINGTTNNVGGIVGYANSKAVIKNCANHGNAAGAGSVGGIIGGLVGSSVTISDCYNTGNVTATGSKAGGIFGASGYGITVNNCYNKGEVKGASLAGGIGGEAKGETHWSTGAVLSATTVSNCYNVGKADKAAFGSVDAGSATVENCYYLDTLGKDANAEALAEIDMKSAPMGDGFKLVCKDYPALKWQTDVTEHSASGDGTVVAPTCTAKGYTEYTCANCGETFRLNYVAPTDHKLASEPEQTFPAYKIYECTVCHEKIMVWNDARMAGMTLPEANAENIAMADNGNFPWKQNEENARLESSNQSQNKSTSETSLQFTLPGGGYLKFAYGVSSEKNYDKYTVTLNNGTDTEKIADGISGTETGSYQKLLPAGTYTLTFSYSKDDGGNSGDDTAYISDLQLKAYDADGYKQAVADQEKAAKVVEEINNIGEVTTDSQDKIKDARKSYEALTDSQKEFVDNYDVLLSAEAQLVEKQIDAIGEVTLNSEKAIKAARKAYVLLNQEQRDMVKNYQTLVDAENKLAELKKDSQGGGSSDTIKVSFRLIGSTLSSKSVDLSKGVPDGYYGAEYQTWIKTKTYTLPKGSTVYDLFVKALADAKLESVGAEDNYVSAIYAPEALGGYKLSEFTNGPRTGWMYTINGNHADFGLKEQELSNKDKVVWHYVNDYSYEVEDWTADPGHPSLGDATTWNKWLEAADVNPSGNAGGVGGTTVSSADDVIKLIDKIGTVTKDSGNAIKEARAAYDKLTDKEKAKVTNYAKLTAAEKAYADLTKADENGFTDVKDHWAKDAINFVVEKQLFNGTTATTFEPETAMNRAMLVTVLWRLDGKPAAEQAAAFADVEKGSYYADAVAWANANGIVKGYSETQFAPNDKVTREQLAAILYRYAQFKGYDVSKAADLSGYKDFSQISAYAVDNMKWAAGAGIVNGRSADTLAPQGESTRAEVATMLMRFVQNVK